MPRFVELFASKAASLGRVKGDLPSAIVGALLGAVIYRLVRRRSEKDRHLSNGSAPKSNGRSAIEQAAVAGVSRATRHTYTLPGKGDLPELRLDIMVAKPPCRSLLSDEPPIILYVLDPEPLLFGSAALFAYAQAGYYASDTTHSESVYRRMTVVGVGHSAETISLDGDGFDAPALRTIRRRDFPPRNHPAIIDDGRGPNAHAARFVQGLCDKVVPYVELELLGLQPGVSSEVSPQRALLGASYSGVVALQALIYQPTLFTHFILGSPSVCFDPEILHDVEVGDWAGPAVEHSVGVIIILGKRERKGKAVLGNVHDEMTPGCQVLANKLKERGLLVEGINEVGSEDHGTVKMPLVSQGMGWLTSRVKGGARKQSNE